MSDSRLDLPIKRPTRLVAAIAARPPERAARVSHRHVRAAGKAALEAVRRMEQR